MAAVPGHSGAVLASSIGTLILDGSLLGGSDASPTQNAQESGEILSAGSVATLIIGGGITGASGVKSGYVSAGGDITSIDVTGDVVRRQRRE